MRPAAPGSDEVSFQAYLELLRFFLARRDGIVGNVEAVLNAQRKPSDYLQNRPLLFRHIEDCFFTAAGITPSQARLKGRLEDAHWSNGFKPRDLPGLYNGLIDPAEMLVRGFHLWQQTRWPGRNGRVHYAHTLFNLYVLRCLALLSMRLWDGDSTNAGERLSAIQSVLDELWKTAPSDQPVLLRDARWLIPLAQSPATDDLAAYFVVAENVAGTLATEHRLQIHKASVLMTAGHLRSQIRYHSIKQAAPLDETSVIVNTRISNALDFALLIQDLVPLLQAYEEAWQSGDGESRIELADAICQGVSPDPELFVNRVELLAAHSMIEHLFITTDREGQVAYTPLGQRHVHLLQEYRTRIGRLAKPLTDDCHHFKPIAGTYSPHGVLYGFSTNLIEHMALKTLQPDAVTRFGIEDVFVAGDAASGKLAWVSGWRKLPHLKREVATLFDYPQQFAEDVFDRIVRALRLRAGDETSMAARTGRLFVVPAESESADSEVSTISTLPLRYIKSCDRQIVAAQNAEYQPESQLSSDRREGRCVISYKTSGGWVAMSKAILTEVLGTGHDAKVIGVPAAAAAALKLMCPDLVVLTENSGHPTA
jgi:hypothetical protein